MIRPLKNKRLYIAAHVNVLALPLSQTMAEKNESQQNDMAIRKHNDFKLSAFEVIEVQPVQSIKNSKSELVNIVMTNNLTGSLQAYQHFAATGTVFNTPFLRDKQTSEQDHTSAIQIKENPPDFVVINIPEGLSTEIRNNEISPFVNWFAAGINRLCLRLNVCTKVCIYVILFIIIFSRIL